METEINQQRVQQVRTQIAILEREVAIETQVSQIDIEENEN